MEMQLRVIQRPFNHTTPSALVQLLAPGAFVEVLEDDDAGAIGQDQVVVHAGEGAGAPPLIVDAPGLSDVRHAARARPGTTSDGEGGAVGAGVDVNRGGDI